MLKLRLSGLSLVAVMALCSAATYAQDIDMSGFTEETSSSRFDDAPVSVEEDKASEESLLEGFTEETPSGGFDDTSTSSESDMVEEDNTFGFTGKLTEQIAYSLYNDKPHNAISSVKTSLFLDYEHKFENGWKVKANAKAYYDAIYDIRGTQKFSKQEVDELKSEVELFDAYVEGSITENLDMKLGRQVVVWGRSDTIRVTDVLNPLDNRRPGMVDIEDLRLPVTMVKFDFFFDNWRVTPIAILEQRFSKNPPFGSVFNPSPIVVPANESYDDVTYALSIGGEFSGWDVNFYAAQVRNDEGQLILPSATQPKPNIAHDKIEMYGTALNVLTGSWLFKTELAYFNGLKYTTTGNKEFSRTDVLLGVEYNGIADTLISYDVANRHIVQFDDRLIKQSIPLKKNAYQHALRISSDFMNATVKVNYLLSLFGKKLDEGGFQRAWVKYEFADGININVGVVDYIGGSFVFDAVKDNDMFFADISYNF